MKTKKLKISALWLALAFGLLGIVAIIARASIYSEKYTAKNIEGAFDALTAKYSYLDSHFGNIPHFYESITRALIKEDYSVLELLVLDEQVVNDESVSDYAGLSLPSLPAYIHEHRTQYGVHTAITVGGYPVVAYTQNPEGYMVMTIAQVSKNTLDALEQTIDNKVMDSDEDNTGRLHYHLSNVGYEVSLFSDTPFPL